MKKYIHKFIGSICPVRSAKDIAVFYWVPHPAVTLRSLNAASNSVFGLLIR